MKSSRKKQKENTVIPADLYWELRCSTEELDHQASKLELKNAELECLNRNIFIAEQHKKIHELKIQLLKLSGEAVESSYNETKGKIEKLLGLRLADCEIDPITREVRKTK